MRKSLLLTVTAFCIAAFAQAQITKGSVLLGGNISAGSTKYNSTANGTSNNSKQNGFNLSPFVGFATSDNKVWGVGVSYSHGQLENSTNNETQKSNAYGASLIHRRYYTLGKSFYIYGQGAAGYSTYKANAKSTSYENVQKSSNAGLSVSPGVAYAVNKYFHLEISINDFASMGYTKSENIAYANTTAQNTTESENLYFNTNFSSVNALTIGFRFVLGK
jgi:hypothetical protein